MSDLDQCPDCGHAVSRIAISCPKCGRILIFKGLEGCFQWVGVAVLVGILWLIARAC